MGDARDRQIVFPQQLPGVTNPQVCAIFRGGETDLGEKAFVKSADAQVHRFRHFADADIFE